MEPTEEDLERISAQIKDGNTSGHLSDGENRIYWEIKINKWRD